MFGYMFVVMIIAGVLAAVDAGAMVAGIVFGIVFLVFLIYFIAMIGPSFCILVRRLHDIGKSGHWLWLMLVPYASIVLFVWTCFPSKLVGNPFRLPSGRGMMYN